MEPYTEELSLELHSFLNLLLPRSSTKLLSRYRQMTLFTRALGNVHTIEPYIKDLSVQKNIDRRLRNGDGYSEHDDDDERSDADSVEHPPPSAWDDDFDSRGSSPTAHLEVRVPAVNSMTVWVSGF